MVCGDLGPTRGVSLPKWEDEVGGFERTWSKEIYIRRFVAGKNGLCPKPSYLVSNFASIFMLELN
jgi:hypothetical protein